MHGFTGRVLHVDLSSETLAIEQPEPAVYRRYLGGSALGLRELLRSLPPGSDPLGPANVLVLATGPLAGTPISGQSRISVNARSPLSGGIGDSQMGGTFPAELKRAGFDAIVVRGQARAPVWLWVHDGRAELRPAAHLWGLPTADAEDAIRAELGEPRAQVAAIGPAGERLVRFASLLTMGSRAAGRTGMGAVLGSKRLKAIAVHGTLPVPVADPDALRPLQRAGTAGMRVNAHMLGLQTYGTAQLLEYQQATGSLPAHNWQEAGFAGADRVDGTALRDTLLLRNDTCWGCAVRCKRVVEDRARGIDPRYGGPESQALATFGPLCGVDDLGAIALASQRCNAAGMDALQAGAAVAFAIDCYQQGRIGPQDTGGRELHFGDAESVLWLLDQIVARASIGDTLAEGIDHAARCWDAEELRATVKGGALPTHLPHAKRSLALVYAVNPFGADHQSSEHDPAGEAAASAEERRRLALLGLDEPLDPEVLDARSVRFAFETQKLYSLLDSASVCQLVFGAGPQLYGPDHLVMALRAVTGWDWTLDELLEVGERRLNLLRLFNAREGIGRGADVLPRALFRPLRGGPRDGQRLDPAELERALEQYYALAGWDPATGYPLPTTLRRLGIDEAFSP